MSGYAEFLSRKLQFGADRGFDPLWVPDFLFDYQRALVEWAVRKGRAALFEDCGLGKSVQELVWAENVCRHTNGRVLILTPLAVGPQMVAEAERFGMEAVRTRDGTYPAGARVVVANYQILHKLDPAHFAGVVCDESGVLKNADGKTRKAVTEFLRTVPYRLLATATAAPNDYDELGTSAEAVGELGHQDMLTRFFKLGKKADARWGASIAMNEKWHLRPHAAKDFWRWVCSWARACRRPSDLGFADARFELPPLHTHEHEIKPASVAAGRLFDIPAVTLAEQKEERRRTITERCEKVAELVTAHDRPAVCWCGLNPEGDLLEKIIPGAEQVSGKDSDDAKEEKLAAFAAGQIRVLVSKPVLAGFGLNWQHCAHQTYFPSHSFEQWYQAVRRSWRFGQQNPVTVDVVTTPGGGRVLANLQRKAEQADQMFAQLVSLMNESLRIGRGTYGDTPEELPAWLSTK